MQDELLTDNPSTKIRLLGVNSAGAESGVGVMCAGRILPLLQDTITDNVWVDWQVDYRDVVIVDESNMEVTAYNLTTNDLATPANYDALMTLLKNAAGE